MPTAPATIFYTKEVKLYYFAETFQFKKHKKL